MIMQGLLVMAGFLQNEVSFLKLSSLDDVVVRYDSTDRLPTSCEKTLEANHIRSICNVKYKYPNVAMY